MSWTVVQEMHCCFAAQIGADNDILNGEKSPVEIV